MNYDQFEDWLRKLDEKDREYLRKQRAWLSEYEKARKSGVLPKGFSEKTMEILEGGSESET